MSGYLKGRMFSVNAICANAEIIRMEIDAATLIRILVDWLEGLTDAEVEDWSDLSLEINLRRFFATWVNDDA